MPLYALMSATPTTELAFATGKKGKNSPLAMLLGGLRRGWMGRY
jgi:hypothetical protein